MIITSDEKKLHHELAYIGLRAQATAVGLLQLTIELRRAKAIDQPAVDRIKAAIANEISLAAPRSITPEDYRRDIVARLDRLFAGDEPVGPAEALSFGAPDDPTI
jgi:hypothetical protein